MGGMGMRWKAGHSLIAGCRAWHGAEKHGSLVSRQNSSGAEQKNLSSLVISSGKEGTGERRKGWGQGAGDALWAPASWHPRALCCVVLFFPIR